MAEAGKPSPQKIGKYEILSTLGKGAMGVVYRAKDPFIGREVALKTMLKELVEGEEEQQRFFREAQAAGNLKHGNIVTIYELGMDGDTAFIAMELLEGRDLKKLMRDDPNIEPARKLEIVCEILEGLDYAHKRGIVHRDIKPANILIGDDGSVKIMDFGIARVSTSEMTKTGMVLGTVSYMSPEQVAGQKVDGRSDLFAVGVILYEMVTNQKPFPGETISTIIHRIISKDPEPFDMAGLPPGIDHVIRKALAKEVENRYETAGAMEQDLRAVLQGTGQFPVMPAGAGAASDATVKGATASRTTPAAAAASRTMPASRTSRTVAASTVSAIAGAPAAEAPARSSAGPIIALVAVGGIFMLLVVGGIAAFFLAPSIFGRGPTPTTIAHDPTPTIDTTPTAPPTTPPDSASPSPTADVTAALTPSPSPSPELTPIATPEPTPPPTQIALATPVTPPPIETPKATPKKTPEPDEEPEDYEPTDDDRANAGTLADEGRDLLYANKLQAAEAKLQKARRMDPAAPNTYLYLVLTYRKMGKLAKANQTIEQARNNVPGWDSNVYVKQLLGGGAPMPSW